MYRIETTDPITGKSLTQLANMPYVIENNNEDNLVIYFESEHNRDLYLKTRQNTGWSTINKFRTTLLL